MSRLISVKGDESAEKKCEAKQTGRPRCPVTHRNILCAARDLLTEVGFANLTMEGIAARAGVGKTTIYRRWPDKASLVREAFLKESPPKITFPDTGSAREDLRQHMRKLVKELNGPVGRKMSTLLAGGQIEEEIAKAFQTRWFEPWRAAARQFLKRGVERGEVRKEVDMEVVLDALYGPIYFRLLGGHAPLTTGFADALAEMVMRGLEQAGRVRAKAKL